MERYTSIRETSKIKTIWKILDRRTENGELTFCFAKQNLYASMIFQIIYLIDIVYVHLKTKYVA